MWTRDGTCKVWHRDACTFLTVVLCPLLWSILFYHGMLCTVHCVNRCPSYVAVALTEVRSVIISSNSPGVRPPPLQGHSSSDTQIIHDRPVWPSSKTSGVGIKFTTLKPRKWGSDPLATGTLHLLRSRNRKAWTSSRTSLSSFFSLFKDLHAGVNPCHVWYPQPSLRLGMKNTITGVYWVQTTGAHTQSHTHSIGLSPACR